MVPRPTGDGTSLPCLPPTAAWLCRDLAQDVPETTHFAPHVRYEIGAFGWYHIDHLPATYDESKQARPGHEGQAAAVSGPTTHKLQLIAVPMRALQAFVNEQGGRHKFFNVWPYVKPLRTWIK